MKCICWRCWKIIRVFRSSHLAKEHGIEKYNGMVNDNFWSPEELGIPANVVESLKDGEVLPEEYRK